MSKRYLEVEEIRSRLFLHYFLYTRFKYAKRKLSYYEFGEATAHYYLIKLYYKLHKRGERVLIQKIRARLFSMSEYINSSCNNEESIKSCKEIILKDLNVLG